MPIIRLPSVGKLLPVGKGLKAPVQKNGYVEYDVSEEMKRFWESLSPRERETIWSAATKEKKDLRDALMIEIQRSKS